MATLKSEYKNFDVLLTKTLSISHDELLRREAEWKKQRKTKKQAKSFAKKRSNP